MTTPDEKAQKEALLASLPQGLIAWRERRNAECADLRRKVLIDAVGETNRGPQYMRVEIPADARYPSGTPIGKQSEDVGQAWHGRPEDFTAANGPPAEEVWWIDPQPYWGHRDADGGITTGAWVLNVRTDTGAPPGGGHNLYELRMDSGANLRFGIVATFETGTSGDAKAWGSIKSAEDLRTGDDVLKHLRPILDPELLMARAVAQGDMGTPN